MWRWSDDTPHPPTAASWDHKNKICDRINITAPLSTNYKDMSQFVSQENYILDKIQEIRQKPVHIQRELSK